MKDRIYTLFLTLTLIFSWIPANSFASTIQHDNIYGDVNSDNKINMEDVLIIQQYIAGSENKISKSMADVNDDEKIDSADILLLKKFIVGWNVFLGSQVCTINFDSNGGSKVDDIQARRGETIPTIPSPKKDDATFLGWYTNKELTVPFYAEDRINSNLTLYAKYAQIAKQEEFLENSYTLMEQTSNLTFIVTSSDTNMKSEDVLKEINLENVGNGNYIELNVNESDGNFTISAKDGFTSGDAYKLTLNNDSLKFADKPQVYRICNFTITKDEVINININDKIIYIKDSEISEIMSNGKKVDNLEVVVLGNTDLSVSGTFKYNDASKLKSGDTLCVYENIKPTDRNTTTDYFDDSVAYIEVTQIEGNTVSFKNADSNDVIDLPDTLPIAESDLTSFDDKGTFTAQLSKLDFSKYTDIGLNDQTTIDTEDYLVITRNDNSITYGKVKSKSINDDSITIEFEPTTVDNIKNDNEDYYTTTDVDGEEMLKDVDIEQLENEIETQALDSGFAEQAMAYLANAATKTDGFKNIAGPNDFIMTSTDSSLDTLTLDQIEAFNSAAENAKNIKVEAIINGNTEHFGKGLHAAVRVSGEITINQGESNEIVINLSATFVEELRLTLNANGKAVWKWWKGFFPYISDYKMNANIDVYDFTGVSVNATVTLKAKDDGSIDISEEIKKLMGTDSEDDSKITAGTQDLFEAYGDMLKNNTDYVDIVDEQISSSKGSVDPYHIIAYAYNVNFVVGANVNLSLGCNLQYESGTRYNFWFTIRAKNAGNSTMDLMDESFNFQFYAMGHLGLRMGIRFEFAVGLFSTDLDSIGIIAEAGPYVELFGYFFYDFNSVRDKGTAQFVSKSTMRGALYFEFGIYMDLSFKAQVLNGKYYYNPTIFKHQWPLLHAGVEQNVYNFGYDQPKDNEELLIKNNTNYTLPDSLMYMNRMDLKNGELSKNKYNLKDFYYTLSNKNFILNENTGKITVNIPNNVHYQECDLTITWKSQKLAFAKGDMKRTIHLVWTDLTDIELKEKYDVSVKVGNNIVWSTQVRRGEVPILPTENEILKLIQYDKNIINGTNLKYSGYTGYGNQVTAPAMDKQEYLFDVTERDYSLTIKDIQNTDGSITDKTFHAKFGEKFDLSALNNTGTNIEGKTYTKYLNTDCNTEEGKAVTNSIDTTFATELLSGKNTYTAKYVDDSCKINYIFNTANNYIGTTTEIIKKGTVPSFNYSDYLLNLGEGYVFNSWDKVIGKVSSDTTFTATCIETTVKRYTVTFMDSNIEPIKYYVGEKIEEPVVPVKDGFVFNGWYYGKGYLKKFDFNTPMPSNDITLLAKWIPRTYTITLDPTGGECSVSSFEIQNGCYLSLPYLTRDGYVFLGWFTAADGGEEIENFSMFTANSDQTYYAHWFQKTNITGVNTSVQKKVYTGSPVDFTIISDPVYGDGKPDKSEFYITYKASGTNEWVSSVVNPGTYSVKIVRPEDRFYYSYEIEIENALVIKENRSINAPSGIAVNATITLAPVKDFKGYGDGIVEYAVNESTTAPNDGWTTSLSFVNLKPKTDYYLFSRVSETEKYLEAISVASETPITTGNLTTNNNYIYNLGIKTADEHLAGTGAQATMSFLYSDGERGFVQKINSANMEQNSYTTFNPINSRDPWMISGINIGNDGKGDYSGWLIDYIHLGLLDQPVIEINIDRWFDNEWADYTTDFFKRNIISAGGFDNWGGSYEIDDNSTGRIKYDFDGYITDQYGIYNVFEHEDAPQMLVKTSSEGYDDCFSYSIGNFSIDKATLYKKMFERGEDKLTFTISLDFNARSSNITNLTKVVTINKK